MYGFDYLYFETDRTRIVRDKIPVRCAGDALDFDVSRHDASTLAIALERQYDEASDVRVHHVVNRGLFGGLAEIARGSLVSLEQETP